MTSGGFAYQRQRFDAAADTCFTGCGRKRGWLTVKPPEIDFTKANLIAGIFERVMCLDDESARDDKLLKRRSYIVKCLMADFASQS